MWFSFFITWEQRKLGDIGKTYGGLSGKSKEDFGHGDARFVTYMNVFSNPVGDPAMTEAIELDSRQNEVKKGDIFFTTSSETPEEVGMSCVWMENTPNTYLNSFCFGYRPIVELDLYYLAYVLRSNTVRHKFIFLAQGISRYNISKNKVMEMLIPVPNKGEQVLLGAFFKNLDNLITLHQRKQNWQNSRFLRKISSLILAIAWEQRKFGEVFTYERPDRYIVASDKYSDYYSTPVLTANKGFILGYTNEQRTYNHPCVIFDDFTLDSKYVDFPFMVKSSALKILTAKQGYYLPFAYELLHAANIEVLGHARHYISVVQPTAVLVPNYPEQLRIGKFIEAIDNLITLHQCEEILIHNEYGSSSLFRSQYKMANAWEQCKFAEVYSFASEGGTPDTNTAAYYRNGTIPFVRIEDTENKYIDSVKTFVTEEGLKHSSAWLIPSGSVIFTNGATVGNVAINRIPVATKQGILGIIPNKTVMAEYLYYLLSSGFFQREVRNRQATGTFATIILKNLNEINVFVPDKAEQQKISGYLSSIDNLITLHQCKRAAFVSRKSPSIFQFEKWRNTLTWEQRKFKDMVQIERGGSPRPIDDYITDEPDGLNWVKIGDAPQLGNYITKTAEKIKPSGLSKTREVHPGDLILSNSMSFGKPYIMGINGCIHDGWLLIRDAQGLFELRFLCHLLGTRQMVAQYKALASGSTVNNLNKELVGNTIVAVPNKDEQQQIGCFLESIDNLITLHQRGENIYNRRQTW